MKDEIAKRERGYKEKGTIVRPDSSEILVGADWTKRKTELWTRAGGRCERILSDGTRCRNEAHDPHHMKPRSKGRDDRIENLIALCRGCHNLVDWKRIKLRDLRREYVALKKCPKHPQAAPFDGPVCPACKASEEFLALTDRNGVVCP
jgi:hypothetical protein